MGNYGKIIKAESSVKSSKIVLDNLEIDLAGCEVKKSGKVIELTFKEFEILCLLAQQPRHVFGKEQIYDIVCKEPYDGDYCIAPSHIRHILEKLEDDPAKPKNIKWNWQTCGQQVCWWLRYRTAGGKMQRIV